MNDKTRKFDLEAWGTQLADGIKQDDRGAVLNAIYSLLELAFPDDPKLLVLVQRLADGESANIHASGTGNIRDLIGRIHEATRGAPVVMWDDADPRH